MNARRILQPRRGRAPTEWRCAVRPHDIQPCLFSCVISNIFQSPTEEVCCSRRLYFNRVCACASTRPLTLQVRTQHASSSFRSAAVHSFFPSSLCFPRLILWFVPPVALPVHCFTQDGVHCAQVYLLVPLYAVILVHLWLLCLCDEGVGGSITEQNGDWNSTIFLNLLSFSERRIAPPFPVFDIVLCYFLVTCDKAYNAYFAVDVSNGARGGQARWHCTVHV